MNSIPMITPEEVRKKMTAGEDVLLVCSYEEEEDCKSGMPDGATPLREFMSDAPSLPTHQEIIFFCDSSDEKVSKNRAEKFSDLGFENIKVLEGGLSAWRETLTNEKRTA